MTKALWPALTALLVCAPSGVATAQRLDPPAWSRPRLDTLVVGTSYDASRGYGTAQPATRRSQATLVGLGVGAGVGLIGGLLFSGMCESGSATGCEGIIIGIGVAGGALLGALIGSMIGGGDE